MIRKILRKIYIISKVYKIIIYFYSIIGKGVKESDETIMIPMDLINSCIDNEKSDKYRFYKNDFKFRKIGSIESGDWDLVLLPINQLPTIKLFYDRFVKKMKWEDTQYYKNLKFKIQKNGKRRGCSSITEYYEKNFMQWDKVYLNIKENGYKSQLELGNSSLYEIEICISRNGDIIFIDGRHRLSIAKILNIREIPVVVNMWHSDFIRLFKKNNMHLEINNKNLMKYLFDYHAKEEK